ncbi:hypothetical protein NA57DRAFT_61166 [Rhizodiscina lignyota]|uniref:F-box domain-containing protein n=1 Tax=Rhizodiscina lignyota TaxID=1504668 RepID=A0A9P4I6Q3_9PEZI|nr:hypothetical protein NA57DRAFT_61166 [Rhizodiscina lignyota]
MATSFDISLSTLYHKGYRPRTHSLPGIRKQRPFGETEKPRRVATFTPLSYDSSPGRSSADDGAATALFQIHGRKHMFDLPLEIRLEIYGYVLADQKLDIFYARQPWQHPLTRTCRRIRAEALPIMFQLGTIRYISDLPRLDYIKRWKSWQLLYRRDMLANIRKIEIRFGIHTDIIHLVVRDPRSTELSGALKLSVQLDASKSTMNAVLEHRGRIPTNLVSWLGFQMIGAVAGCGSPSWNGIALLAVVERALSASNQMISTHEGSWGTRKCTDTIMVSRQPSADDPLQVKLSTYTLSKPWEETPENQQRTMGIRNMFESLSMNPAGIRHCYATVPGLAYWTWWKQPQLQHSSSEIGSNGIWTSEFGQELFRVNYLLPHITTVGE